MELVKVIKKRRSIRNFKTKNIQDKLLYKIIETANLSPSAGNLQARSLIVIKNQDTINKIRLNSVGMQKFKGYIPILLVIMANLKESAEVYKDRGKSLYAIQDATIFASYVQLLLTENKLASRWVGWFDERKISQILKLSKDIRPVIILPIGYPDEFPSAKERKTLGELILKTT
jgi:nitroreductase